MADYAYICYIPKSELFTQDPVLARAILRSFALALSSAHMDMVWKDYYTRYGYLQIWCWEDTKSLVLSEQTNSLGRAIAWQKEDHL